jgi:hypothetical protein
MLVPFVIMVVAAMLFVVTSFVVIIAVAPLESEYVVSPVAKLKDVVIEMGLADS